MVRLTGRVEALSIVFTGLLSVTAAVQSATAQDPAPPKLRAYQVTTAESLYWQESSEFPEVDRAALYGSTIFAEPYVYRIRANAPAHMPLHSHERREHITVLQGRIHHALEGETRATAKACGTGCFIVVPAGQQHQMWLEAGTIFQSHGVGPTEARTIVKPLGGS